MPKPHSYDLLCSELTKARQEKGLTQSQVAERLGKPQSYVSKYEIGERRLDVVEFLAICKALSISPVKVLDQLGVADDL